MIKPSQTQDTDVLDVDAWKFPAQYMCKSTACLCLCSIGLNMTQKMYTKS